MKVLVAGAAGQLGRALQASVPPGVTLVAPAEAEFDITDPASVAAIVDKAMPDVIINAAAYTAVDKAEAEPEIAQRINADAVANLAAHGRRLVHVSTDFVFDGTASQPYAPAALPCPISVYGRSKRDGEIAAGANALIIRTAWVYAAAGNNFVHTMLRLMRERQEIRVVADQIGTPTHVAGLARTIWTLLADGRTGLWHWTDAGVASWYDFAVAIEEEALAFGLLDKRITIIPVGTSDYPTPARRPAYGLLDKSATWAVTGPAAHWRSELRLCLAAIKEANP